MRVLFLTLALWAFSMVAQAQAYQDSEKPCANVAALKLPTVQPADEADRRFLNACDPADLYYGVKGSPDYPSARRCALYKLQTYKPKLNDEEDIFPTAVAAMIYQNGQGVARNPDLALHLFCAYEKAEPEYGYTGLFLAARNTAGPDGFDFCAIGNMKLTTAECEAIQYRREDNRRLAALRSLMAKWTPVQLSAYAAMAKVHDAYVGAATGEAVEACITGTLDEEMEYDDALSKEFEEDVANFARGQLPSFSHAEYVAADRALNAAYKSQMGALEAKTGQCAKDPGSLRTGERVWLQYRDAWVRFAQVRWPEISADSWLTLLTRERTAHVDAVPVE